LPTQAVGWGALPDGLGSSLASAQHRFGMGAEGPGPGVSRRGSGLVCTEPNSNAGKRAIPLDADDVEALRAVRAAQVTQRLAAGAPWVDHNLVFTNRYGGTIEPRTDCRRWRDLLNRAGVQHARLHDATRMIDAGMVLPTVTKIIGHADVGFTRNTYVHIDRAHLRQAEANLTTW